MLVWKPLQPRLLNRHTVNGLNAIEDILLWSRTISRIYLVTIQPDNPAEYWVSTLSDAYSSSSHESEVVSESAASSST